jgi:hypothetical protein
MINFTDLEAARQQRPETAPDKVDPLNVMAVQCSSCPWRDGGGVLGDDPIALAALEAKVLFDSNQVCHAPALSGKREDRVCRGARNYQLEFFFEHGVIDAPTDKAWSDRLQEMKILKGGFRAAGKKTTTKKKGFGNKNA